MQEQPDRHGALLSASRGLDRILAWYDRTMMAVASASLFAIMVLIFTDAMFRYLFNSPLSFVFDVVVLYLMSAALLTILSYTLRHGGHISIDVFANLMNRRIYLVLVGLGLLAGMVTSAIITWLTGYLSYESWHMGEIMTGIYPWPLWIGKALVALGFLGLTLRLAHIGLANLLSGLLNIPALEIPILHDPSDPEGEI